MKALLVKNLQESAARNLPKSHIFVHPLPGVDTVSPSRLLQGAPGAGKIVLGSKRSPGGRSHRERGGTFSQINEKHPRAKTPRGQTHFFYTFTHPLTMPGLGEGFYDTFMKYAGDQQLQKKKHALFTTGGHPLRPKKRSKCRKQPKKEPPRRENQKQMFISPGATSRFL